MKKFLNYFLLASLVTLFVVSCKPDEEPYYDGDSELLFTQETGDVYVVVGTNHTDYIIKYGVSKGVSGTHQVKLVSDAANSTAVEGVDYQILNNGTDTLNEGDVFGEFTIRVLESGMSTTPKIAKFKLKSETLSSASFHSLATFNMSLTCPISYFTGSFKLTDSFFWDLGEQFDVEEVPGATNKLKVVGFMNGNADLILDYNPTTYVVTFATQGTTYIHPTYNAEILIRMPTNTSLVSSFNPCTRKLTLYMDYWMNGVGGWTNQTEVFQGL